MIRAHHRTHLQPYDVAVMVVKKGFLSTTVASAESYSENWKKNGPPKSQIYLGILGKIRSQYLQASADCFSFPFLPTSLCFCLGSFYVFPKSLLSVSNMCSVSSSCLFKKLPCSFVSLVFCPALAKSAPPINWICCDSVLSHQSC